MVGKVKSLDHRLFARRCVCCGYDGELLRGGTAERCARCGCDLRIRPARSYAEMEGLIGQPLTLHAPLDDDIRRHERIIHRWLAFLFVAMIGLLAIVYLSAAAMGA